MIKWFKKKIAMLSLAMANVEKNTFGQEGNSLDSNISQERRHNQGTLADSLKQGEITQEVMDLRWRTYKILKASEGLTAEIIGYDDDGMPITKVRKIDRKKGLSKIKIDTFDNYPLIMVLDNTEIVTDIKKGMNNEFIEIYEESEKNLDSEGEIISATHGIIKGGDYFASNKVELPINIDRMFIPKFEIENFTKKLNIRKINDSKCLLEFYVSMYPDVENRRSRLFISDVKKAIDDSLSATFLEIVGVNFVTYKTMGSDDFLEYSYNNLIFDKIISFNGHYVIKFISDVEKNGVDITEGHRMDELDKKYENKEKK